MYDDDLNRMKTWTVTLVVVTNDIFSILLMFKG